jgi:putative glycosyltransferase
MLQGLEKSRGDLVFLIDSDLEEDPKDCLKLYRELINSGADVVFGYQERRRGGFSERISGYIFYFLIRTLADIEVTKNMMTSRLMTRRYVDALLSYPENQINFSGLALLTGFDQKSIPLRKLRLRKSSYSLSKKMSILVDAFTSFSSNPLKLIFGVGLLIFMVASMLISFLMFRLLFNGQSTSGWLSLIVSVWFLGGLIMLSLGILGIYISRIFVETKNRPRTIVKETLVYGGGE